MQAGGQEFESLHLHLRTPYAPQGLCPFGRVQARYKIKHLKTLMEASFRHVFKHLILHTYLENRILKKDNLFERKKYQDIRGHIFRKKDTDNKQ